VTTEGSTDGPLESQSVVIDANIIKAIYQVAISNSFSTTESPTEIMESMRTHLHRIVLDDGGKIKQEWLNTVGDYEWFAFWYSDLQEFYAVKEIPADNHPALCKKLWTQCGFPKNENIWLVKTSVTEAKSAGACVLLTEDVDFREPSKKKSADSDKYRRGDKRGCVDKLLGTFDVEVLALCQW
jgi:hypothetical protein